MATPSFHTYAHTYANTQRDKYVPMLSSQSRDRCTTICLHLHQTLLLVTEALFQVALQSRQDNGSPLCHFLRLEQFYLRHYTLLESFNFPQFFVGKTAFCVVTTKKMGLHLPGPTFRGQCVSQCCKYNTIKAKNDLTPA